MYHKQMCNDIIINLKGTQDGPLVTHKTGLWAIICYSTKNSQSAVKSVAFKITILYKL